jgi:hypothetical protein
MNVEIKDKIFNKFVELSKLYYKPGNLIIDTTENFEDSLFTDMNLEYHSYVGRIKVDALGLELYKKIFKPVGKVKNFEFEELFGFGHDCEKYDPKKIVIFCPKNMIYSFGDIKKVIMDSSCEKDPEEFSHELENIMLYGGYVNNRKGIQEMKQFLQLIGLYV